MPKRRAEPWSRQYPADRTDDPERILVRLKRLATLAVFGLALLGSGHAQAAEEPEIEQAIKDQSSALLRDGNLDELDHLANDYRNSGARTPSGVWKLYLLYGGVRNWEPRSADDPQWARLETLTRQWVAAHPQSVTGPIVQAAVLIERAWVYRGTGYANDVEGRNWDPFRNYVDKARSVLDQHRDVAQADPEWYRLRVSAAGLGGDDKSSILTIAEEGLRRHPYYYPIETQTVWALQPVWGGSAVLTQQFVNFAVEQSRSSEGTQAYARSFFKLLFDGGDGAVLLKATGIDWLKFKASLDEIVHAYPTPWNRNVRRVFTCMIGTPGDYQLAMTALGEPLIAVDQWDSPAWHKDCEDWAYHGKVFQHQTGSGLSSALPLLLAFELPISWALLVVLAFAIAVIAQRSMLQPRDNPVVSFDMNSAPESGAGHLPLVDWSAPPDPKLFPRRYWISSGWQFIGLVLGGLMVAVGPFLIAAGCVAAPSASLGNRVLVLLPGLLLLGIGAHLVVHTRRSRLLITIDSVEHRGMFRTRKIAMASVLGRRLVQVRNSPPVTHLVLKPGLGKPFKIEAVFARDAVYDAWLRMIPDLDRTEFQESEQSVLDDDALGGTREQRAERLMLARKLARPLNLVGVGVTAWGWLYPRPYVLVVPLLATLPMVAVLLLLRYRGFFQPGQKPSDARAGLAGLLIAPCIVLGARAALDTKLFDWSQAIELAIIGGLLLAYLFVRLLKEIRTAPTAAFGVALVASLFSYGAVVEADRLLDHSMPQVLTVRIQGKHIVAGRSRSWELTLAPWGPWKNSEDFRVPRATYAALKVGDTACVYERAGALGIAWYEVATCG